ncbi:MAG: DUF4465 domain-containing protein [Bacteroidales bacterium]|nr:DUF4465 domain-containing protein [Bacteroidales bacterium]
MDRKMIRCALLGAAALLAVACFSKGDYKNEYDSHLLVRFEPDYDYQWEEFINSFFDNGRDTVACSPSISIGPIYHFSKLDDADDFLGGICLARGKDADASTGRKPSRFAVFDANGGNQKSRAYAVFHDTTAALMPENYIQILIPNTTSSCAAEYAYVHNVQAAVQAAVHGTGLAEGPFQAGDFLQLTFTGLSDKKMTGTKEVKLIDGTSYLKEWTKVELNDLGKIDALELHLTSSRVDFPLYCCLDDMGYHYIEIYE